MKNAKTIEETSATGWLLQCPPGLANILKKEMVFAGVIHRDQQIFIKRQRNHDLVFLNRVKSADNMARLRIAETILRCPIYGKFKISKRQLGIMSEELKAVGPRRLVVTVVGRKFERHDLSRFITRQMDERGYAFDPEIEDETWMFCVDEAWYFGIPVKKSYETEGRDSRSSERPGSLPPPIAAAIAFASMPKTDDVVIDPVCGSGTLLAECHAYAPTAKLIGCDIDQEATKIAEINLARIPDLSIHHGDSRDLTRALEAESPQVRPQVSLVLANLPFGLQFGSKETNAELYHALIKEQLRVRDPNKPWRALLFTSDLESLQSAIANFPELTAESMFQVKVRGELAFAYRVKFKK